MAYRRPAVTRLMKVMSKAFNAAFQRLVQRVLPRPVGSMASTARMAFGGLAPLVIEEVEDKGDRTLVRARTPAVAVSCPDCGAATTRVHGLHERTVGDLPVDARPGVNRRAGPASAMRDLRCRQTFSRADTSSVGDSGHEWRSSIRWTWSLRRSVVRGVGGLCVPASVAGSDEA